MESAGYFEWIPGIVRVDGNVKALYDAQSSPYDAPSALTVGATITNLKLYINDTTGAYWNITTAKVSEAPVMANVKEGVKFDFNFTGSGSWSYPTGAS